MSHSRATEAEARNTAAAASKGAARGGRLQRFFRGLGPGLITGAADDDPSAGLGDKFN